MECVHSGAGIARPRREPTLDLSVVIREVQIKGYAIGREVRIGTVAGTVVGYNIARRGKFRGASFPLVVQTPFGVAKCSVDETQLA